MRSNTCRVVLLTSMFWLLIDVVLVMRYSEFFGDVSVKRAGETDVEVRVVTKYYSILTRANFNLFTVATALRPIDPRRRR